MGIQATYLGMPLQLDDLDVENLAFFKHCAAHNFHLQKCAKCGLLRYPPTTACPWCMSPKSDWVPVDAKGAGDSFTAAAVAALVAGDDLLAALVGGAAAGASNVTRRGLASGRREVVDALADRVTVDRTSGCGDDEEVER